MDSLRIKPEEHPPFSSEHIQYATGNSKSSALWVKPELPQCRHGTGIDSSLPPISLCRVILSLHVTH